MPEPVLQLEQVTKTYGSGKAQVQALRQANFAAEPGQLILILGPSGSGKSTFLNLAGGLITPTSGTVRLVGQDLASLSPKARDRLRLTQLGFVLQSHNLVPYLTVAQQFALVEKVKPQGNMSATQLQALLAQLGVAELVDKYPSQLSGGQRQRVAIARALYSKPAVVLADEPTAALDSASVQVVGQLLRQLAEQQHTALVVVTHDQRLVPLAHRVFHLTDGVLSLAEDFLPVN